MSDHGQQREAQRECRNDAPCTTLVTGATGFIGRQLCRRLMADGDTVIALTRHPKRARKLLGAQVRVVGSLQEIGSAERIDAIVNLAGAPIFTRPWTKARRVKLLDSRIRTTNNVVELIARLERKPEVLISASAIGYYGVRGDEEVTEETPGQPIFQSQLCQSWEQAAQAAQAHGVRVCRLRFGIVLGIDGGALPGLIRPARMHLRVVLGSGRQWQSWVHIDDLLGLVLFCMKHTGMSGAINVTAPHPVRQQQFATILALQFGSSIPMRVPAAALRIALGEMSQLLLEGQKVLPAKASSQGFAFRFSELTAALAELMRSRDRARA